MKDNVWTILRWWLHGTMIPCGIVGWSIWFQVTKQEYFILWHKFYYDTITGSDRNYIFKPNSENIKKSASISTETIIVSTLVHWMKNCQVYYFLTALQMHGVASYSSVSCGSVINMRGLSNSDEAIWWAVREAAGRLHCLTRDDCFPPIFRWRYILLVKRQSFIPAALVRCKSDTLWWPMMYYFISTKGFHI